MMHSISVSEVDHPLVAAAFAVQAAVARFLGRSREFYYAAMLFQRECPHCQAAKLEMLRDSCCRCHCCQAEFDPTIVFQPCPDCGTALEKRIYHYWCPTCRQPVRSIFCFDARVFDQAYFREMMRQSRQRNHEKREAIRQLLLSSRSAPYASESAPTLDTIPGLDAALDVFVGSPIPPELVARLVRRPEFDMQRYRDHILGLVTGCVVHFDGVQRLIADRRLDRVFRFITVIFLEQERRVLLTQTDNGEILIAGR